MKKNDIALIFCPPLSEYKEPPKDMSKCEAVECPDCKNLMWLSVRKKAFYKMFEAENKDIILSCYICLFNKIKNDPGAFELAEFIKVEL